MTQVQVNEPSDATAAAKRPWPRRRKPRVLILFSAAGIVLAAGWFVALPWLLRNRVEAVLRDAGIGDVRFDVAEATPWGSVLTRVEAGDDVVGIERLKIEYSPLDLWNGKLHGLRIRGGRLELRVRDGRVDLSPLTAFVLGRDRPTAPATNATSASTSPGASDVSLPVERIELVESTLVLQTDGGAVQIPVDLSVHNRSRDQLLITAAAGPARNLLFEASVNLAAAEATFDAAAEPGWTLLTIRSIWPDAAVGVDGVLKLSGDLRWGDNSPGGRVRLAVDKSGVSDKLAHTKLRLSGGVFEVTGQLGPVAGMNISLSDATVAGEGFSIAGLSGAIALTSVSPPETPPGQRLTAAELEIGGVKMTDGLVEFQVIGASGIHVGRTEWHAFGGTVAASDFDVEQGKPIALTVQAKDIELKELLATFAKDKASGEGKLTGELPIVVDGSDVTFGSGRAVALERGRLQIKDAAALAPAAEGAAAAAQSPSQSEQIKRNIIEALSDFEYDKLTTRLESDGAGGLSAFVRMSGRGRTGARQALDYDLRVRGLDGLIRSYFGIRRAMDNAESTTRKAETL